MKYLTLFFFKFKFKSNINETPVLSIRFNLKEKRILILKKKSQNLQNFLSENFEDFVFRFK
jgi:hypothetical protein